jgi:K+-transporting ATPase ATPase B chain
MDPVAQIRKKSLADSAILSRAILDSFRKLNPRTMVKNPVMFVVEVGAVLTTIQLAWNASHHAGHFSFGLQITLWLCSRFCLRTLPKPWPRDAARRRQTR